mmetsp:Transcript_3343/g.6715  ORF Transcript_3343/g.6715 Transcript_3343/m.6715 type:complete len:91 (+) Transcript_3343:3370-3642(+)
MFARLAGSHHTSSMLPKHHFLVTLFTPPLLLISAVLFGVCTPVSKSLSRNTRLTHCTKGAIHLGVPYLAVSLGHKDGKQTHHLLLPRPTL